MKVTPPVPQPNYIALLTVDPKYNNQFSLQLANRPITHQINPVYNISCIAFHKNFNQSVHGTGICRENQSCGPALLYLSPNTYPNNYPKTATTFSRSRLYFLIRVGNV
jgi:hypothetical protein